MVILVSEYLNDKIPVTDCQGLIAYQLCIRWVYQISGGYRKYMSKGHQCPLMQCWGSFFYMIYYDVNESNSYQLVFCNKFFNIVQCIATISWITQQVL